MHKEGDMAVFIGDAVPSVEVDAYVRGESDPVRMSLDDLRGKWVVLFFYPRDFTFVCPTELAALAVLEERFAREGAVVVAASTDSFYSHKAWFESDLRLAGAGYPVLADTSHALSEAFGVLMEDGTALRATFIIDPHGSIRHAALTELNVGRNLEETVRTVTALATGELCPAGWQPGEPTLSQALEPIGT